MNLGSAVSDFPITFSVAGKRYVTVSTGMGLATAGAARLSPEVNTSNASSLFVFALP